MLRKFIRHFGFLLSVGLLALTLALAGQLPTLAQGFPGLGWSEGDITSQPYVPTFTRGNLEVAPVFLDGQVIGHVAAEIELKSNKGENPVSSHNAATRSYLIHSKLQKILDSMTRYSQEVLPQRGIATLEAQEEELSKQLVVNVSQANQTAVVLVAFPKDDVPEIVYSVTQSDVERPRFGGSQPLQIAERVSKVAKKALIQAWQERQPSYLLAQGRQALLILVALSVASLCLIWGQKHLAAKQRKLSDGLAKAEKPRLQDNNWTSGSSKVARGLGAISPQFQTLYLRQRYSLNAFYRAVLFWLQWLMWLLGIGYITSLFYWSRPLSNWIRGVSIRGVWSRSNSIVTSWQASTGWPSFDWLLSFGQEAKLGTPMFVLLLLLGMGLALKAGDALSDFLAQRWSQQQSTQRYTLRAPTLARAIKGWLRVIVYLLLGALLVYHLHNLGTITQIVAVFLGFLSFALSLASQDLLKDLIGGLLILWEDQYAVGDVIIVDGQGGLVENITLRVTQLRNLDGELITIPNRSIEMVRNLSSDWSRVNYAIEVGYDADVEKVMETMETVAQEMYGEPEWQEQILEAPEILGIDNIAHTGILIRMIIKTKPLQQWSVARQFRLRLKKAFDEQGIQVGVPQQVIYVDEAFTKSKISRENHQQN
jgi:small conductance mechanosensitive channel